MPLTCTDWLVSRDQRAVAVANPQAIPPAPGQAPTWEVLTQATIMTALAGFIDALGYSAMNHLYLSFMSGNSTQFGMAIPICDAHVVRWAGAVIGAFVLGAFLGSLVHVAQERVGMPLVFACELVCLVSAWSLDGILATNVALLFVALAMGMQNTIHKAVAGAATGKSFITGALFGVGDALARAWLGRARFAEAGANAVSWLAFVVGVACGALAVGALGVDPALQISAGIVLVLMMLSIFWPR